MDCGKYHVMHDMALFCLQAEMITSNSHIKSLLVHITTGKVLAYLKCHAYTYVSYTIPRGKACEFCKKIKTEASCLFVHIRSFDLRIQLYSKHTLFMIVLSWRKH